MNQEFNPRLLWDCAEPYLSQTLTDIKGAWGGCFLGLWRCCGWLSGGVVLWISLETVDQLGLKEETLKLSWQRLNIESPVVSSEKDGVTG